MIFNIIRLIVLMFAVYEIRNCSRNIYFLIKHKRPLLLENKSFKSTKLSIGFYILHSFVYIAFAIFALVYLYESIVYGIGYIKFIDNNALVVLFTVVFNISKRLFDKIYFKEIIL